MCYTQNVIYMASNGKQTSVTLPRNLLEELLVRSESLFDIHDKLEDFFMSRDKALITKLRKARKQHINGELIDFADLKKKYV